MINTLTDTPKLRHPRYLQSSGFVNDLLIGMADGMLLPFALAAALSFITSRPHVIALITGAESVMLAFLFGVAAYQSVVNQAQEYPGDTAGDQKKGFIPHLQLIQILHHLDLGPEILERASQDGLEYETRWNELLHSYGLGSPLPNYRRARKNGFFVALSFLMGAVLPIAPYLIARDPVTALKYAAGLTFAGLLTFGICKAAYTGVSPWGGVLRLLVTGVIIAVVALVAAYLVRG